MRELIAVVDDEEDISELVAVNLKKAGFTARTFADGTSFLRFLKTHRPALVILDLMLPDMDGFDICKQLKSDPAHNSIPVIMLSARGEETDKLIGLELGADDYMTKPFSPRELAARVKVVLRRKLAPGPDVDASAPNAIAIDPDRFRVTVDGRPVTLTTTEMKILQLLQSKRGYVFSREQILDYVWGDEKIVIDRTVDVHIKNLREKLGATGKLIKNIRGIGYKLE